MKQLHPKLLFALLFFPFSFSFQSVHAQLISGNGFLKGNFVEAGIQPNGSFGSKISAPSDFNSNTSSRYSGRVGFIADVGKDGWKNGTPAYIGRCQIQ